MHKSKFALAAAASASVSLAFFASQGQAQPETNASPGEPRVEAVTFDEPLVDRGNETAKALAAIDGVSIGEATRRLRLMHAAGRIKKRLPEADPERFAGVFTKNGRVVVKFADKESPASRQGRVREAGVDADLMSSVATETAQRSLAELNRAAAALAAQKGRSGLRFDVAIDHEQNSLRILTQDVAAVQAAIRGGTLEAPAYATVEQSAPIELTAELMGGRKIDNSGPTGCTSGFVLGLRTNLAQRYVSTAGHCEDPVMSIAYPGGTASYYPRGRLTNGSDIMWGNSSWTHTYPVYFWNGNQSVHVNGAKVSAAGDLICTWGQKTNKQLCGRVQSYEVYSSPYGNMSVAVPVTAGTYMSQVGDSGGPVWFSTGTAVGTIHGRQGYNLLFTEIGWLDHYNQPVTVLKYATVN